MLVGAGETHHAMDMYYTDGAQISSVQLNYTAHRVPQATWKQGKTLTLFLLLLCALAALDSAPSSSAFRLPPLPLPSSETEWWWEGECWSSPDMTDEGEATTGIGGRTETLRSPGVDVR